MIEERIPVQIFGQTYEVLGNAAEALYYTSLARYVEDKMKEIQRATNIVSTQKIAILAAMNIADELLREKENKSSFGKSADKKAEDLIKLLNKALEDPGQPQKAEPAAEAPSALSESPPELSFS